MEEAELYPTSSLLAGCCSATTFSMEEALATFVAVELGLIIILVLLLASLDPLTLLSFQRVSLT
jgi:hypothetical protein